MEKNRETPSSGKTSIEDISGNIVSDAKAAKKILWHLAEEHDPDLVHAVDILMDNLLDEAEKIQKAFAEQD